jgi:hypothetical protein
VVDPLIIRRPSNPAAESAGPGVDAVVVDPERGRLPEEAQILPDLDPGQEPRRREEAASKRARTASPSITPTAPHRRTTRNWWARTCRIAATS